MCRPDMGTIIDGVGARSIKIKTIIFSMRIMCCIEASCLVGVSAKRTFSPDIYISRNIIPQTRPVILGSCSY